MPFSKSWDEKAKIVVFPFRRNNAVVCHNCWQATNKEDMNCCTGLCSHCEELNPVNVQQPRKRLVLPEGPKCTQCGELLKYKNFGIHRQDCEKCSRVNFSMQQRCIVCDTIGEYRWNNICCECIGNMGYLCENNGYPFLNQNHHYRVCWCLNHEEQAIRGQLIKDSSETFVVPV